jgi:hypothetical protein
MNPISGARSIRSEYAFFELREAQLRDSADYLLGNDARLSICGSSQAECSQRKGTVAHQV